MAKNKYDNYSKEQLIAKLKQLEKKRYGLVWEDKSEDIVDQCERELPVLVEDKSKEITNDPKKSTHFIFEGEPYLKYHPDTPLQRHPTPTTLF